MSFGVASCSDLLQKGQKSDEYEVLGFEAHAKRVRSAGNGRQPKAG